MYKNMSTEQIFNEVSDICKKVFNDNDLIITNDSSADSIDSWDSISNLFFIDTIEQKFSLKFSLDEIMNAQNIGDICAIIDKKSNK
jgi:acyl carrier protein